MTKGQNIKQILLKMFFLQNLWIILELLGVFLFSIYSFHLLLLTVSPAPCCDNYTDLMGLNSRKRNYPKLGLIWNTQVIAVLAAVYKTQVREAANSCLFLNDLTCSTMSSKASAQPKHFCTEIHTYRSASFISFRKSIQFV